MAIYFRQIFINKTKTLMFYEPSRQAAGIKPINNFSHQLKILYLSDSRGK